MSLRSRVMMVACSLVLCACGMTDERYEGEATRCAGNNAFDFDVMLILDGPVGLTPKVQGFYGWGASSTRDTWAVAEFDDGEYSPSTLKVEAVYDNGNSTTRHILDLERDGSGWKGDLDILSGNDTTRCDVELTPYEG